MQWLLIVIWISDGLPEVTTERFDTLAECEAVGGILAEWPRIENERQWICYDLKGSPQ